MQDIDFDELDRAVNSVTKPDTPSEESSTGDTIAVTNSSSTPPESSSPAARRSSGRFMDVVHPSSDMRTSSMPERSAPRSEPVKPMFETSRPDDKAPVTDMPDPLDFHGFNLEDTPEKKDETPEVSEEKPEETTPQPLESPFLTNMKVEKRPLGAFSTDTPEPSLPELPVIKEEKEDETPLLEAPEPEELLEAETDQEPEATPEVTAPEPTPAPVEEEVSTAPTSITQQYKEQPSTTDQPSGAIFDTTEYHQALTHTPKKKSSALVIVWIAALILVGAGAGAAVYFFVLPML